MPLRVRHRVLLVVRAFARDRFAEQLPLNTRERFTTNSPLGEAASGVVDSRPNRLARQMHLDDGRPAYDTQDRITL
jgi:hypothetical protein